MRVLAVDHGTARAGFAICDPTETVVTPLAVVESADATAVARLVAEHAAELVVVGVPVSLDGSERGQAAVARGFRDELEAVLNVPVETYDERFTTRLAAGSRRAGAAAPEDALAAAHLLTAFLDRRAAQRGGEDA